MKNKSWLGYLGSLLIFFAGILMLASKKYLVGIILILTSIVGAILKFKMNNRSN